LQGVEAVPIPAQTAPFLRNARRGSAPHQKESATLAFGRRASVVTPTKDLSIMAVPPRDNQSFNFRLEVGSLAASDWRETMSNSGSGEAAKAVVRRNTEEVQGKGNFEVFDELFADDFVDHTPQPAMTPDKPGTRSLYKTLREAFLDFHAVIHWQTVDGEIVRTFRTYHGTHQGTFLGVVAPTGRRIHFEALDAMRVHNGKITEHWGVANLFSLMQQLGA
jgi:predicted ester cyclase